MGEWSGAEAVLAADPIASERPRGLVLLGHPVAQSRSPRFQGAAIAHAGLTLTYAPVDTPPARLPETLAHCAAEGLAGNVTVPLKELVAARCARLTPVAATVGAVNTFWWESGVLVGHNTDVHGARATINALCPDGLRGPVVVLGAGGSAAAVLVALASQSVATVTIITRTPARGEALLARLRLGGRVVGPGEITLAGRLREAALVVNATPVGMRDDDHPVPIDQLGQHTAAFDLVYRDGGTPWTRAALASGRRAEDGLRMLVEQGAAAFRAWFGIEPSRDAMWRALGLNGPPQHAP